MQKRTFRSDPCNSQPDIELTSLSNEENLQLSEKDFEYISNKIANKISKRLRDTEFCQREILRLIESLSSRVDNLSSVDSEQDHPTTRTENNKNTTEDLEEFDPSINVNSNKFRELPNFSSFNSFFVQFAQFIVD